MVYFELSARCRMNLLDEDIDVPKFIITRLKVAYGDRLALRALISRDHFEGGQTLTHLRSLLLDRKVHDFIL